VRDPRPHDLLRVFELDTYLPADTAWWVKSALHGSSWVVTLGPAPKSEGHRVGVRGPDRSQRYTLVAPGDCVADMIVPEDVAGVRASPTRDLPALQSLREVRAPLNHLGLPWGPIGSVGFELATGLAATSRDSDLDLIIRVPDFEPAIVDRLWSLHNNHSRHLSARVDCLVEGPVGTIALTELTSGADVDISA
jgi:phosphoribosyl-dephospho-CoA transferase